MHIRKATQQDCPQLLTLIKELAEFEHAADKVRITEAHFRESGFGEHPVWWAFVAEDAGKIVAMALYYIRFSTWTGQKLYLEDLIVSKAYRGQGIGHQLFDRLLLEAKARGFSGMMWQALDWNQPALDFYQQYHANFDEEWVNCTIEFNA